MSGDASPQLLLPDTAESVDLIAEGWLEKKERFERIAERMRMEEADIHPGARHRQP